MHEKDYELDAKTDDKTSGLLSHLEDFLGGDVIVNFVEPNVANRRGVILSANAVFLTFQSADAKKMMIPWASVSYISKEF